MAKTVFMEVVDPDTTLGQHPVITLGDLLTETVFHQFLIPSDFVALTSASIIFVAVGTGDMVYSVATNFGAVCAAEAYNAHSNAIGTTTQAAVNGRLTCLDITAALTGVAVNDLVGISFTRYGAHGSDSINANCYYLGIRLVYV